jgi:homoserine dehydrogenase
MSKDSRDARKEGRQMELTIALIGFGKVGRALVRLMQRKRDDLRERHNLTWRVTGISTGRHGLAADPAGLDVDAALAAVESSEKLDSLNRLPDVSDNFCLIHSGVANTLVELSPLNPQTGQPALDHCRAALDAGLHIVTANKGPLAYGYHELRDRATAKGRAFFFESTVMDGAPIFSMAREGLQGADVIGFRAILNSTTNLILTQMESDTSFDDAVKQAQAMGVAEADPSNDVDGWDAATKTAVLVNVLMDGDLRPTQVDRTGIRDVTPQMLREALARNERIKLLCRAWREGGRIHTRVAPEAVSMTDPFALVTGTNSVVRFTLDTLPGLTVIEEDAGTETTAFGVLADLISVVRHFG